MRSWKPFSWSASGEARIEDALPRVAVAVLLAPALAAAGCGAMRIPWGGPSPTRPAPVAIGGPRGAELSAFDRQDRTGPYRKSGVIFVGSSSIRFCDLDASFPGRECLNRGFRRVAERRFHRIPGIACPVSRATRAVAIPTADET